MQPICNQPVGIVHADAKDERYGVLKKQREQNKKESDKS